MADPSGHQAVFESMQGMGLASMSQDNFLQYLSGAVNFSRVSGETLNVADITQDTALKIFNGNLVAGTTDFSQLDQNSVAFSMQRIPFLFNWNPAVTGAPCGIEYEVRTFDLPAQFVIRGAEVMTVTVDIESYVNSPDPRSSLDGLERLLSQYNFPGQPGTGFVDLQRFNQIAGDDPRYYDSFDIQFAANVANSTSLYPYGGLSELALLTAVERGYLDQWDLPAIAWRDRFGIGLGRTVRELTLDVAYDRSLSGSCLGRAEGNNCASNQVQ
jgi:hypothetical protein